MKAFADKVRDVVSRIPAGEVLTYGEVAAKAGRPGAARAVGSVMRKNADYDRVPCHRVVRADGVIGEYNRGGTSAKIARLKKEGVRIERGRVVALRKTTVR